MQLLKAIATGVAVGPISTKRTLTIAGIAMVVAVAAVGLSETCGKGC